MYLGVYNLKVLRQVSGRYTIATYTAIGGNSVRGAAQLPPFFHFLTAFSGAIAWRK
jgi:hypothetical protein